MIDGVHYATHLVDGRVCRLMVSYNHSTTPTFYHTIISRELKKNTYDGHPKRNGVTKTNGWKINEDFIGKW